MPAIATNTRTGNAYVDGMLGDYKWATNSLTYSFPTDGSYYGNAYGSAENAITFGALNTAQQTMARSALAMYGSVANLRFAELTESATQHADLRIAMSDKPSSGWAYLPTTAAEGGDAWFNRSIGLYTVRQRATTPPLRSCTRSDMPSVWSILTRAACLLTGTRWSTRS